MTIPSPTITALILAGGQGRRMGGQDKGLMPLDGSPIIEHLLDALKSQADRILINANRNQAIYQQYGTEVISDQLNDYQGPLAGFASAMQHLGEKNGQWLLTLPCDGPRLAQDYAQRMWTTLQTSGAELVVAHDGERLQPVHALIPTHLLSSLHAFLDSGERKIDRWYAQHHMAQADFSDSRFMFQNINTPEQKDALENRLKKPAMMGICAYSGTGKTTLLTQLIPLLKGKGLRLTVIKHGHHTLELDKPGKDSFKFREAGADQVLLASSTRVAIMQECHSRQEPRLQDVLKLVDKNCADLILVEGFKHEAYPKLEVYRPVLNKPLLFPHDEHIVALVTDTQPTLPDDSRAITQLDLNHPESIADFIMEQAIHTQQTEQAAPPASQVINTPSCADAYDPDSLALEQAQKTIMQAVQPLSSTIKRPLRDTLGQVLAQEIISPLNVPSHTNSAMDGYALSGNNLPQDELQTYRVIGTALAGKPFTAQCQPGECIHIMTGAMMPANTDTVVMQEHTERLKDTIKIGVGHKKGQNVRQAGEDIAIGQTVLAQGRRLTPADLGLLASLGIAEINVYRPPRVAFFSTGDELRSLGEPLDPGCIYDSNRYTLYSLLTEMGADIIDMGVVPDQPDLLEAALREAAENADMVLTSGGVSVGEADYIKDTLETLGDINFWKIAIKPGRPLTFGHIGNTLFFGLPGNPVAVMVTFHVFVQPALLKLAGETCHSPLILNAISKDNLRKKPGRSEFIRGIFQREPDGRLTVEKAGHQGSGILSSMSRANCFILLPEASNGCCAGDLVSVQPIGRFS